MTSTLSNNLQFTSTSTDFERRLTEYDRAYLGVLNPEQRRKKDNSSSG
jgi:hypothetical protein